MTVTPDGKAGVLTGELVLVTPAGIEPLHEIPRGFMRVSDTFIEIIRKICFVLPDYNQEMNERFLHAQHANK
jgi:hypothetical protein